ncbi:MAG: hypothetical protein RBT11_02745 [Desulfobacterales bacterium]|jgi:hypothetical protein|nr:hypothetical protein [Desulfobacterales bacterium]
MLDVAVAYNRYKFLGFEFLTWVWFCIENNPSELITLQKDLVSINIGNHMVLENRQSNAMETISIKGDDAGLEEGRLALQKGAMVTEINLLQKSGDQRWQFTIKGESLSLCNLKIPETGPVESREDIEGVVLERSYLYDKAVDLVTLLFNEFIKRRISDKWHHQEMPKIKKWITAEG